MATTYFFETYTTNPETGEDGWDIVVGTIRNTNSREAAIRKLERRFGTRLGSLIQLYPVALPMASLGQDALHLDGAI